MPTKKLASRLLGKLGTVVFLGAASTAFSQEASTEIPRNALKNAYFGNLHIHTNYPFDGYTNGSITNPADAYPRCFQINANQSLQGQ